MGPPKGFATALAAATLVILPAPSGCLLRSGGGGRAARARAAADATTGATDILFPPARKAKTGAKAGPPASGGAAGSGPVSLSLAPAGGGGFAWGKVAEAAFVLENLTEKAVVVTRIEPVTNRGEGAITLSGSVYGCVEIALDRDEYEYSSLSQRTTALPFHAGFLLPGQRLTVVTSYRPVSPTERFAIRYASADAAYDGTPRSLGPFRIYLPAAGDPPRGGEENRGTRRYVPFVAKDWLRIHEANPLTRPVGPGAGPRAVIIPIGRQARSQTVITAEVGVALTGAAFPLEVAERAASRIAGRPGGGVRLALSDALGGWVVAEGERLWCLSRKDQASRGTALPSVPFALLKDADARGAITVRVGDRQEGFGPDRRPTGRRLWGRYPVEYGDGMYTRGEFIRVAKAELRSFLEQVAARGGKLTEHRYYFRSKYYVLVLPGEGA